MKQKGGTPGFRHSALNHYCEDGSQKSIMHSIRHDQDIVKCKYAMKYVPQLRILPKFQVLNYPDLYNFYTEVSSAFLVFFFSFHMQSFL